ncbi:IS6 family transposase [Microbulbifer sp. 2205BS26-8]|uniref:IS6 family transposase n=1 Tax=Microbulbifer sp. 2205BS26-8 TaxID=3064386 RepID=UPI00273EF153|nr:IS6 family transposase [Microbulbifer sp. 2205BS26-8]MDP5211257.1 IS6 family transposase [Microbulbifer sp. 2205BS26-8]
MISFKGAYYPKNVILYAVFFYVRYTVSYRDLEKIMQERRVTVDHATLNRWVVKYSSQIAKEAKKKKRLVGTSWRMDETYIKLKGKWVYLYRAVDKSGKTVDFMLSKARNEAAATHFFEKSIGSNGVPEKVVIDKSGANLAGLTNINIYLFLMKFWLSFIDTLQVKYLNNIVEQNYRFIKRITKPMMGFKAFHSAAATLDGIETAHMIRKGQLGQEGIPAHRQFMALAG